MSGYKAARQVAGRINYLLWVAPQRSRLLARALLTYVKNGGLPSYPNLIQGASLPSVGTQPPARRPPLAARSGWVPSYRPVLVQQLTAWLRQ